jgi:hypothetical protein
MGDFSYQSLEGKFSHEEFGGFLIFSDFSESDGSRSESVGLLYSAGGRGALAGMLLCELFSGHFGTGLLSSGQFCSGHFYFIYIFSLLFFP